jgi:hypothetical protein
MLTTNQVNFFERGSINNGKMIHVTISQYSSLLCIPLNLTTTPDFLPVMTDAPSVLIPYSLLMSISLDLHSSNNTLVIFSAFAVYVVICTLDKKQAEFESYARTVSSIFHHYSNSALRANKFREIQKLLNLPELKYAEVHSVRCGTMDNY